MKKQQRPKIVEGRTYKIRTNAGKLFLTVNEVDGKPLEVFVRVGKAGDGIYSLCEAIGRLVSLSLRYNVPAEEVKKTLSGIGGSCEIEPSVPTAIASVIGGKNA